MDYSEPIEIAKNIYWVGYRSDLNFDMNVFLRVFEGNGRKMNMLIDPGPHTDFDVIASKVEKVLGPGGKIHIAFINHQDPDVCINTRFFQRHYPNMQVVTSEDTWRLIRFYGLDKNRFTPVEKFKGGRVRLATGHRFRFVPTPYAHFRGACALFDDEHQILFSGDLFGGLSANKDLFAVEDDWAGIKMFHQIYMPTNKALRKAVTNIKALTPNVRIIAPQHGKIIERNLVGPFTEKLVKLEVGLDIETSTLTKENYINALNEILEKTEKMIDPKIPEKTLQSFKTDGSFPEILTVKEGRITGIKIGLEDAVDIFSSRLCSELTPPQRAKAKPIVINSLATWQIVSNSEKFCEQPADESAAQNLSTSVISEVNSRLKEIFG